MATKRIADEPAYVLHRYDWSETSLILEVFTRHHGRVALVAKGAKRPTSSFRSVRRRHPDPQIGRVGRRARHAHG
jgi:DNA repair protein RecO (recombination protein O)